MLLYFTIIWWRILFYFGIIWRRSLFHFVIICRRLRFNFPIIWWRSLFDFKIIWIKLHFISGATNEDLFYFMIVWQNSGNYYYCLAEIAIYFVIIKQKSWVDTDSLMKIVVLLCDCLRNIVGLFRGHLTKNCYMILWSFDKHHGFILEYLTNIAA